MWTQMKNRAADDYAGTHSIINVVNLARIYLYAVHILFQSVKSWYDDICSVRWLLGFATSINIMINTCENNHDSLKFLIFGFTSFCAHWHRTLERKIRKMTWPTNCCYVFPNAVDISVTIEIFGDFICLSFFSFILIFVDAVVLSNALQKCGKFPRSINRF